MRDKRQIPTDRELRELIGDRLRRVREVKGYNQETFGTFFNVSGGTQSKYESGISSPGWRYLWLLEHDHQVPLAYLWTGSTKGMPDKIQKSLKSN